MAPAAAVVAVEGGGGASSGGDDEAVYYSCRVAWLAWWDHARSLLAAAFPPCPPAAAPPSAGTTVVRGTLFMPAAGDRRVRLFLQEHGSSSAGAAAESEQHLLALDLPAGLGGAEIAAAGRVVLEYQRQWAPTTTRNATAAALLDSPRWLVYCNGRRAGFAARRGEPSDAEGWALEKLRAVTAGAGRLPGGGAEYLRGRFERVVGSPDAESFHLVEPIGWPGVKKCGGGDGGLSIFFHRI